MLEFEIIGKWDFMLKSGDQRRDTMDFMLDGRCGGSSLERGNSDVVDVGRKVHCFFMILNQIHHILRILTNKQIKIIIQFLFKIVIIINQNKET